MASSADKYSAYNPAPSEEGPGPIGYLALVLAWVVPGLGHLLIGQKARGVIFMVMIHGLFGLGLLVGGIRVINPPDQAIWTYTQFLTGWPMVMANKLEKASHAEQQSLAELYDRQTPPGETVEAQQARTIRFIADHPLFANHPKIQDLGAVYCGIAGMLNLLVMFDVLLRITGSVREDPVTARKRAREAAKAAEAAEAGTAGGPAGEGV